MERYRHYINGEFVEPSGGDWFETFDPYTGQPWAMIARGNAADVESAVDAAHEAAFDSEWSRMTASQRGALLMRLGDLVERDAERLAAIEVRDNGKLMAEMLTPAPLHPQVVPLLRRARRQDRGVGHPDRQEGLPHLHALRAARRRGRSSRRGTRR